MKKLYFLTLGLLLNSFMGSAQNIVTNETTSTGYTSLNAAWNALAADGDVLVINENTSLNDEERLRVGHNVTVKGASQAIELKRDNTKNPQMFIFNSADNKVLTLSDLTIDGNNTRITNKTEILAVEKKNCTLNLTNVIINNVHTTSTNIINVKSSSSSNSIINFENVKINGTTYSAENPLNCDISLTTNNTVNIKGNNKLVITVPTGTKLNVTGELTNEEPIVLNIDGVQPGSVVVAGCTDPSKFKLANTDMELIAQGNDLVVVTEETAHAVYVETPGVEAANISNCYFLTFEAAVNAVVKYNTDRTDNVIETAKITVNTNQSIGSRLTISKANYEISAADGKDISIALTANNIALMINAGGNISFNNLTFTGGANAISKNQFEVSNSSVVEFNNITVNSINITGTYVMQVKSNGKAIFNNVQVTDCNDITAFAFIGSKGSSVTGNSNTSFILQEGNVNAEGWTPSETIDITLPSDCKIGLNNVMFSNFTADIDKLKLTNLTTTGNKAMKLDGTDVLLVDPVSTGIDDVTADNDNQTVEYYNMQGVRVENPANGIYIKRQGSKVEKVIVR